MKTVELSDETYATLERIAAERNLTIEGALVALLRGGVSSEEDALTRFLKERDFLSVEDLGERYLKLLSWCALNHPSDFADFISHQESGRRYLILSPDEVDEVRARNQARQLDGTPFWAVTTIGNENKLRFVRRLLEFIGCHDQTVRVALQALDPAAPKTRRLKGAA